MKVWSTLWLAVLVSVLLSSCSIGNGRICGPQTPKANCNKDMYQKLLHPTPYLHYWVKHGATTDQRLWDGTACGGGYREPNMPSFSKEAITAARLPEETDDNRAYSRLFNNWESCMKNKGYRYTP